MHTPSNLVDGEQEIHGYISESNDNIWYLNQMTLLPALESQEPSVSKDLNLYEGALNTTDCHYTLPHYTKRVIMYPTVISGFYL
jgi:hypothetical protein